MLLAEKQGLLSFRTIGDRTGGLPQLHCPDAGDNNAADCAACKAAGKIVDCPKPHTIADGLQGRLGSLTWPPVRDLVTKVVTVSEAEILAAMQLVFERMKVRHRPFAGNGILNLLYQIVCTIAVPFLKRTAPSSELPAS